LGFISELFDLSTNASISTNVQLGALHAINALLETQRLSDLVGGEEKGRQLVRAGLRQLSKDAGRVKGLERLHILMKMLGCFSFS
jgi:hypothetical protein